MVHHKGQIFYDLIYVKSSERSHSKRNKVASWLPGAGDKGRGELVFDSTHEYRMKRVLDTGCTIM